MDLIQFFNVFGTNEKVIDFFIKNDLIYKYFKCEKCDYSTSLTLKKGHYKFRCCRSDCRCEKSAFYGTILFNSKVDYTRIMLCAYLWLNKLPLTKIYETSGLNHITGADYISLFKEIILSTLESEYNIIGGDGIVVEIDETKISKKTTNKEDIWIFGGIERTQEKKIFLIRVKDRKSTTLSEEIIKYIKSGSIINSDMWKGYCNSEELGFNHFKVNHSKYFRDPESGACTNTIEGIWSGIKRTLQNYVKNEENINSGLFEYIWRRKNKNNEWNAFINALKMNHIE